MFSSYDDFPLPVGPNMAFSPGLMIPLEKITQNYFIIITTTFSLPSHGHIKQNKVKHTHTVKKNPINKMLEGQKL